MPAGASVGQCFAACDAGTCATGRCTAQLLCVECEDDTHCTNTPRTHCVNNRCEASCRLDRDCRADQHCDVNGVCVTAWPLEWPDAGVGEMDAGVDAGVDAGADASVDAGRDGGDETPDAAIDGGPDAPTGGGAGGGGIAEVVEPPPPPRASCASTDLTLLLAPLALLLFARRRRAPVHVLLMLLALSACEGQLLKPRRTGTGTGTRTDVGVGGGGVDASGGGAAALGGGGGSGGGGDASGGGGAVEEVLGREPAVELRRLTQAQVRNALTDVFGPRFLSPLPLDADEVAWGLTSIGTANATTSALAAEQYLRFFTDTVHLLFTDGTRRQALVGATCAPREANDPCVRAFYARLARKLWRRPATVAELNTLISVVITVSDATNRDLWQGIESGLVALLASPNFGYRLEVGAPVPGHPLVRRYTDFEVAQRLAFTLWDSVPDDALLTAAEQGHLSTAAEVRAEARRMLADPRGRRGVLRFFAEHFELDALASFSRDSTLFPNLSPTLPASMREELARTLAAATFREGPYQQGGFLDLLDARTTWVNADLQALYGLPVTAPADGTFVSITHDATSPRGGVLGMAGFLAGTSKTQRTSPTLRGRFIRQRLLCEDVANPPPDVNATFPMESADGGTTFRNMAERLQQHSVDARCSGCHRMMDPLGLGLERFDAVGAVVPTTSPALTFADGGAVHGTMDDETTFDTARGLGALLKTDPRVPRCLVRQSLRWVFGRREATAADVALIDTLTPTLLQGGDVREVVVELVASAAFRTVPNRHTVGADTCAP